MFPVRSRAVLAAGMLVSLIAGLAVANSTGATTPDDTVAETSIAATPETVADTSAATIAEAAAVEILPPGESFGGLTLGEWGARWWQWSVGLPRDVHPAFPGTGERCGYGQHGPVFFLPPSLGELFSIECVVPEGTAIYVIVSAVDCSSVEGPPWFGGNEQELHACLDEKDLSLPPGLHVAVDGQPVTNLDAYGARSPMFTLNVPEDGLLDFLPPGVALAMVANVGFIVAPPPPGDYVITGTDEISGVNYTANVTVEAPQVIEAPPTT